jgi:hypothetical protein
MPKIGIFWVHRNTVIGNARNLEEGQECAPGLPLLDSPDTHVRLWDSLTSAHSQYPELSDMDYEMVPRGRVLYDRDKKESNVYFDRALNKPSIRKAIAKFFELDQARTDWGFDPHYATDQAEIDRSFE